MVAAVVLREWGPPEVLVPAQVEVGAPGPGQVRIDVRFAGVGPTDLAIRAGHLPGAFGSGPGSVLGFEVAGVVESVGDGVVDVRPGDAVAAFLPELGGYAEQVLARHWVRIPDGVDLQDAAALPASGEAAARVVEETRIAPGETVLVVGAAGSVGQVATQLAVARGARVLGVARVQDATLVESMGAEPVASGPGLAARVRALVPAVDAVIDASGAGILADAVDLAGGTERVVTLSDPAAAQAGVRLSGPDGPRVADRLATVMALLADGRLRLRARTTAPLAEAAAVHRDLESGAVRAKVLLVVGG
ncbi:quinone oxidoreductase family protein [Cellulomonas sp. ICMP 17802]|uniref:quinone oxidoreductase family protein n=1 Tax=Cellulomonas sp. ICMP 17802 TaxID=3239199 RepID=UPI00351BBC96